MNHCQLSVSLIFICLFVPSVSLPQPCDPRGSCPSFFSLASCLSSSSVAACFSLMLLLHDWLLPKQARCPFQSEFYSCLLCRWSTGRRCLFIFCLHCFVRRLALCSQSAAFLTFCNVTLFPFFERNFQKMFPYGSPPLYGLI